MTCAGWSGIEIRIFETSKKKKTIGLPGALAPFGVFDYYMYFLFQYIFAVLLFLID
jgi:hypothetical protein